jgi:DNA helicase-2/ATP-dependent DNA helicase PcrA
MSAAIDLPAIARQHPDAQNSTALAALANTCRSHALTIQDLAAAVEVLGKVVLTNYHTAKGREFDTVILPGLVNGIVPFDVPRNGTWERPTGTELAEQRRTFFVAVSRAQTELHCLTGPGYHTPWGRWIEQGPSDFVIEMEQARNE